jgi:hypothetical protein
MIGKFTKLTDADLERIFNKYVKKQCRVQCAENHEHGFDCIEFEDEQTMILDRLRVEVIFLRAKLKEICKLSKD